MAPGQIAKGIKRVGNSEEALWAEVGGDAAGVSHAPSH